MKKIYFLIFFYLFLLTETKAQWSIFDDFTVTKEQVNKSLYIAKKILKKQKLKLNDIKEIYFNEIIIGKFLEGNSFESPKSIQFFKDNLGKYGIDSSSIECAKYIVKYRNHFRKLIAGWKNERTFYEPNKYWIDFIKQIDPNSDEAKEIMFDYEFKDLVRQFTIDYRPYNTCEEYSQIVTDELKSDFYRKKYSEKELNEYKTKILNTIPICKEKRKDFLYKKNKLLKKYKYAPFTKKLQNINVEQIYVFVDFSNY